MDFFIPELPPGLNGDKGLIRMHFHAYRKVKERWMWLLRQAAGTKKAPHPCHIKMERYYASQPMDFDNAYSSVKVPGDAMRAIGLLVDDDPSCVAGLTVTQHKVKTKKEQGTWFFITPA